MTKGHGTNRQPNNTTNSGHGKSTFISQLGDGERKLWVQTKLDKIASCR